MTHYTCSDSGSEKRSLSKAFCWRCSIPLVTSRKSFGLESLFIAILKALLVKLHLTDLLRSVENITRSWGKNISKKSCKIKSKRNFFIKRKSSYKNIQYSSHLLPCILLCRFISWTSRKTIMPNCIFFFQYQT